MSKIKKYQEGFALAVVLGVMFLVVVISSSLLLTAGMLIRNRNRTKQNIQSRMITESLSEAIIEEIEYFRYHEEKEGPLEIFIKEMDDSARFNMTLKDETLPGETVVECYWIAEETDPTGLHLLLEVTNTIEYAKSKTVHRFTSVSEYKESWGWKCVNENEEEMDEVELESEPE